MPSETPVENSGKTVFTVDWYEKKVVMGFH